jgi:hypothetical protein
MDIEKKYTIHMTQDEAEIWDKLISNLTDVFLKDQIKLNDAQIEKLHNMYITGE